MLLARFIIEQGLSAYALLKPFVGHDHTAVRLDLAVKDCHLQGAKCRSGITVCKGRDGFDLIVRHGHLLAAKALRRRESPMEKLAKILLRQLL